MKVRKTVLLPVAIAVVVGSVFLAAASAGPPPAPSIRVAATRTQPVGGHTFTGITVSPLPPARISWVRCVAHISGHFLHSTLQRFYAAGVQGPQSVSCTWRLPKGAAGRFLRAIVYVGTVSGLQQSVGGGGGFSWRMKR